MLTTYHIHIKKTKEIEQLYALLKSDLRNAEIYLNLKGFKFFFPIDIVQLAQLIISIANRECSKIALTNAGKYLNGIDLVRFCNTNYVQPNTQSTIPSQTAMPIKRVERENMVQYIDSAKSFLSKYCPGKDLTILNIGLSEFINNVYDHAESEIGAYVFCQYYPKSNSIRFAVSDLGVGIPNKVNKYMIIQNQPAKTSEECIRWALEEKKTVKSTPKNAGLGLHTIMSFVKSSQGKIRLLSGNGGLYYSAGGTEYFFKNPMTDFRGTVIDIEIFVNNLHEIDPEETDFDF